MLRLRLVSVSVLFFALGASSCISQWVWSDLTPRMYPEMNPLPELGSLSAQTCKKCHNQIYEEWSQTNHGLAEVDPLYQADRVHQGEPFVCANCHTPLVEQQETLVDGLWMAVPVLVPQRTENPRYDPALKLEGVTCVVCHQVDGAMEGPHIATSAPHPTRTTDRLANPNACAGCHTLVFGRIGDFQRPLMETITEWEQYRAAGGDKTCIDCHMPKVAPRPAGKGGPPRPGRDHRLRGPFNADFVRTAASVQDAKVDFGTNQVEGRLTLFNETGHRLPTPEPHRWVDVILETFATDGKSLGRSSTRIQRLMNIESFEEEPGNDTTLLPREARPIILKLGVVGAARAVLRVDFIAWNPDHHVSKALNFTRASVLRPIWSAEFSRKENEMANYP